MNEELHKKEKEGICERGLADSMSHLTSSPQTLEKFRDIDDCLRSLTEAIKSLENHSIERGKKVDEMYEYFIRGGNVVWFIKWIFGTAATVGGLIVLYKSVISSFNGQN